MSLLQDVFSTASASWRLAMITPYFRERATSGAVYADLYDLLEAYYKSNRLYDDLNRGIWELGERRQARKPLRNPAFRVVEFYASKVWPGDLFADPAHDPALRVETENASLEEAILQVWKWSNWNKNKQGAVRTAAWSGDLVIKVAQRVSANTGETRVFFESVRPQTVTDLDTDERGYVTYVRLDVPREERVGDKLRTFTHTEVWSKDRGDFRRWEHDNGPGYDVDRLGPPAERHELAEYGIDFVPFVHAPFRDISEARGAGAFVLQLSKVDEVNAMATRLHENMFRYGKPIWAVMSGMMSPEGEPLPAPRLEEADDTVEVPDPDQTGTFIGSEPVLYIPGEAKVQLLIPNIAWQSQIDAVNEQMKEIEADLPELTYFRIISDLRETSARTLAYSLSPAVDRVIEVRGNLYAALIRANQMAMTIGQAAGVFSNLGEFDAGDLDHSFTGPDIIPLGRLDIAEAMRAEAEAAERHLNAGIPHPMVWERILHYRKDDLAEIERLAEEERQQQLEEEREHLEMQGEMAVKQAAQEARVNGTGVQDRNSQNVQARPVAGQRQTPRSRPSNRSG